MTWWKCLATIFVFITALLVFLTLKCDRGVEKKVNYDDGNEEVEVQDVGRVKQHVPKFMLDLYHQNRKGVDFGGPDVVRSVVPKTTGYSTDNTENHFENKHELIFDLPKPNKDEQFIGAELKILSILEGTNHLDLNTFIRTSIFDSDDNLIFKEKLHYHRSNTTWLTFNLTLPLLKTQGQRKVRVVIAIKSSVQNGLKLSLLPDHEDFEHDYPVLLLSYTSVQGGNKENIRKRRSVQEEDYEEDTNISSVQGGNRENIRKRRSVQKEDYGEDSNKLWDDDENKEKMRKRRSVQEEDYEEDTNKLWDDDTKWIQSRKTLKRLRNTCKRRPLYIDFSEIEYDTWIVQPSGYEAYQCQGKCFYPVAEHLSPTKHAIVQALLHSVSPLKASRSCCVPTRLDPISVLYVDANGVLTYRYAYKDMVVVECGCR